MNDASREILLVYDTQCPACDYYCKLARIRETVGSLRLIDARDGGPVMDRITNAGLDIDEGMVLIVGDALFYGADAIHHLALLGTRSGLFNRLAYHAFRTPRRARILYPVLARCRNLLLKVLRRTRINNLRRPGRNRF